MYNDIYSKVSTPMQFAQGLTMTQYKPRRKSKRELRTDQEKAAYIKIEHERRRIERLYFELKWQLNMAFIEGEQYQYISNITNDLVEYPKLLKSQEREAYNHIKPIHDTKLAKLARLNLLYKARPASQDSDDINNATVTTKILKNWAESNNLNSLQLIANEWMESTGTAIWKTIWNKNQGKQLGVTLDGKGNSVIVREGDPENVICSPFEIFPDSSYNQDIKACKSIIHARVVDPDYIFDNFGVDIPGEKKSVFANSKLNSYTNTGVHDTKEKENVVMLYEYYEVPSNEYPNGKFWICCDGHDKLLYEGELPFINSRYNNRGLPFDLQRSEIRPGYFWGRTMVDSLIPVQRRYNAIKNRMTEYLKSVAVGIIVIDEATAELNNLESEGIAPGDIITYNKTDNTQIPTYMQTPPISNAFFDQEKMDLNNFTEISGVSEISKSSTAPTGVESGRALNILNEQDETRLSLTAKQIEECMLEVAKKTMYLYKQFADSERILRIVGQGDAVKSISWDKNTITADDIVIEGVARIGETLNQKRNMVMELLNIGMFRDETGMMDDSKILEMLEFGDTNIALDSKRLERIKSNEQNIKMSIGQPQAVEFYELHSVALETHTEYMLSSEFDALPIEIKQLFMLHIQQHAAYVQQAQIQAQQQLQAQAQQPNGRKQVNIEKGNDI